MCIYTNNNIQGHGRTKNVTESLCVYILITMYEDMDEQRTLQRMYVYIYQYQCTRIWTNKERYRECMCIYTNNNVPGYGRTKNVIENVCAYILITMYQDMDEQRTLQRIYVYIYQ